MGVSDVLDDPGEPIDLRLIEPGGRLVHEEELGVGAESPGNTELPLVSMRQGSRRCGLQIRQAEHRYQPVGALSRLVGRGPAAQSRHLDVLPGGETGERVCALKRPRQPEPAEAIRPPPCYFRSLQCDSPGVRGVEAGDDVDEGGLAGPVGADEPDDLVPGDLEGHVVEGNQPRKGPRHPCGPQDVCGPQAVGLLGQLDFSVCRPEMWRCASPRMPAHCR